MRNPINICILNLNNTDYKLTMYKKYIIGYLLYAAQATLRHKSLAQAKQLFLNGEFEQANLLSKSW